MTTDVAPFEWNPGGFAFWPTVEWYEDGFTMTLKMRAVSADGRKVGINISDELLMFAPSKKGAALRALFVEGQRAVKEKDQTKVEGIATMYKHVTENW